MRLSRKPLVSVVLASYNHKDYIKEAVESVLEQTIKNIELIVVDDGSTDGTPEIVEKITDPRLKLIRLKENRCYNPRNIGISKAKGTFIAFQNSDDKWHKNKLEKQLPIMKNKEIAVCFTGVEIINEKSKTSKNTWAETVFTTENKKRSAWLRYFFETGNCFFISSALIRKKTLLKAGGLNPSLFHLADLDLWIRLAALGEIQLINKKLTMMRILPGKNLSEPSDTSFRRFIIEYSEVLDIYSKRPVTNLLKEIFKDIIPKKAETKTHCLGALADYCWEKSPAHSFLGNKIIAEILKDDKKREELVQFYGNKLIIKYIEKKGLLEISEFKQK